MRLLILPSLYPQHAADPSGVFIQDQARALATRHDVTVLVPRLLTPRGLLRRRPADAPDTPRKPSGAGTAREIVVTIPNLSNRLDALTHRLWQRRMVAAAGALLARHAIAAPGIVHAHFVRPAGPAAIAIARRCGAKAILTEHSAPFSVQLDTPAKRRTTTAALAAMDRVVAVSPSLAAAIRAEFPDRTIDVVGNVVDEAYFSPGPAEIARDPARPFRFLFVGGLTWHKGLDTLLAAAAGLAARAPEGWQIVLAGDGPDRDALAAQARASGLGERVLFAGRQTRAAVRAWMRSSDVFVLPSRVETFGVVLIEAMACGLPVLATDCGGPAWVVGNQGGTIVPPGDARALTDAMAQALAGGERRDREAMRRAVVARFGRDAWLAEIERVYASAGVRG